MDIRWTQQDNCFGKTMILIYMKLSINPNFFGKVSRNQQCFWLVAASNKQIHEQLRSDKEASESLILTEFGRLLNEF